MIGILAVILVSMVVWDHSAPRVINTSYGKKLVVPKKYLLNPSAFWVRFAGEMDEHSDDVLIQLPKNELPCHVSENPKNINVVIAFLPEEDYAQSRGEMLRIVGEARGSNELMNSFGPDSKYLTYYSMQQGRDILIRCAPNRRCAITAMVAPNLVFSFSLAYEEKKCIDEIVSMNKTLVDRWTQP